MRVVNLQIVEENVSLLSLHSSTQHPEEFHEIWGLDWKISLEQCHNSSLNIYRSHNSNAFETNLCFINLQRSISSFCPISCSNLIACKACFVDKKNLHVARWVWSLKEASCVWFCWLQSSKLQLIISWSAWHEALLYSTCKLFWALKLTTFCPENVLKQKSSLQQRECNPGIQLPAGWAFCLDSSDKDTCLKKSMLGQSQLVWCISTELLLVLNLW